MIQTGFEPRVKVQEIIANQLPSFILDENPKAVDFLKQYYISQEYQGGTSDISENLDQYLKVDNLVPEVIVDSTKTVGVSTAGDSTINVSSTKGFPETYGLLKIDDEIITYTGKSTTSFTGCVRGFSGITNYHESNNSEELVFSTSSAADHASDVSVQNLSTLFLKEFYTKLKSTFTPGLENVDFSPSIDAGNFIKEARSFYESKGTDESFKILCKVLYGVDPTIVNLEDYLIKPSSANFVRRFVTIAEAISGNPINLIGQQITKSTDSGTNASVSDVEAFTRGNRQYFKISLFIGYDDLSTVRGTFIITPATKATEKIDIGASVVSVDSTIGFAESGTIISGKNTITYTSKSVNQFYGCTGITEEISPADNVRSNITYFGYENGDTSKKVELRLTGVLSNFVQLSSNLTLQEGDIIGVKNLGSNIKNPSADKSYKEIFANSWIYNTSSRYEIADINNFTLSSPIDRSSIKKGDRVEILERDSNIVKSSATNIAHVDSVLDSENRVTLDNLSFTADPGQVYDLRRKLNTASSTETNILHGNNQILSDVLNVYDERGEYAYVASNSLPSGNQTTDTSIEYGYDITKKVNTSFVSAGTVGFLTDVQSDGSFKTLKFSDSVPFSNGDRVYYKPDVAPLVGLETGSYYVSVVSSDGKQINLYSSRSFVGSSNYLTFSPESNGHRFTLYSQRSNVIGPQKLLKKFPLNPNIKNGTSEVTSPGATGMLINGVEISNYKSDDKIYFGPVQSVNLLNGGSGYDVINLPSISVSDPDVGTGTTALVNPVVSGSIEKVYVDPQNFDINSIVSIGITGGNGSGGVLEASLIDRFRNIFFDARRSAVGGGINTTTDQIVFNEDHNLVNGEEIVYSNEDNTSVGYADTLSLIDGSSYFPRIDNNRTIRLFENLNDSLSGINTINFTNGGNGTQKFTPAKSKRTIASINVIDGGSNYTNRNLMVKPAGINTGNHTVNFINHGFADGDTIVYRNTDGTVWQSPDVVGVTTLTFKVLKVDDDSFKLANIGVAGTNLTNFNARENIRFETMGSGVHHFKFPDISVTVNYTAVGFGTTTQSYQTITATPVVRGSIIDAYLYESGTGYGSTILNHHKTPLVTVNTGSGAVIDPAIINGKFESITIDSGGREYTSLPSIQIDDPTGLGVGAELRPIISGGKLTDVIIVNPGIGYSTDTTIKVKSSGANALFDANVRDLCVLNNSRFNDELLFETNNNLEYSVLTYFSTLRTAFKEDSNVVSNIIGWAYDGNPIYGPFVYSDPQDTNSAAKRVTSGYELDSSAVIDRPSDFDPGYFKEDYKFTNNGDLDEFNGMFAKTPEFPNGVYAYYATLDGTNNPQFPYFIGDKYRSNTLSENKSLNQTFDFNSSNLLRNTFPYKVSDSNADNDFIIETSEVVDQKSIVESASKGSVTGFNIVNRGDNYKVNDVVDFDSTVSGGGLISKISEIQGRPVTTITTNVEEHTDAIFTLDTDEKVRVTILPQHDIINNESVVISGFSTTLSQLNDSFIVGVTSFKSTLIEDISAGTAGVSTEIYLSQIPSDIAIDSRIGIGTETLTVLEIFDNLNVLKVERGLTGLAHTATSNVGFLPNSFTIDARLEQFDSQVNDKVFFNPAESVGVSTIPGVTTPVQFSFGKGTVTRNIPSKSIIIEGHPFVSNQEVTYTADGANIGISTSPTSTIFNMPSTVFIVDKNINTVGIKTTRTSSEVFFRTATSTSDKHSFESKYNQVLAKVQKVVATIGVSTFHDLKVTDTVSLNVQPSLSVGIGTSTAVQVKRNAVNGNILINPIDFNAAAIDVATNQINIVGHGFKTGDKVDYDATTIATGLSTQTYYVFKVDDDNIQLSTTKINVFKNPPTVVDITAAGGSPQTLSPINPQIQSIKNNNLVFDISDSSLTDYSLKIYYDNEYNNEIVSISTTGSFTIVRDASAGTVGAAVTIMNNSDLPKRLYYNIEKTGFISTSDKEVSNYSEILFTDSSYKGDYKVSQKSDLSFQVFLDKIPEKLSYTQSECDILSYDTTSTNASGPVSKLNLVSGGSNYEKFPQFNEIVSDNGKDAFIIAKSDDIGNASRVRVINEGFEYSSDKTLQPTANIDTFIEIKDSNTIGIVSITEGGKNYIGAAPSISIVNPNTRKKINSGILIANLTSNSITSVDIINQPKGLPETTVELFAENNTNGVSIQRIDSNENSGVVTCHLTTPTLGFSTSPFKIGDQAFLEGIQNYSTTGTGFNSPDIGYRFYDVTNYETGSGLLDKVTLQNTSIVNAGLAKTDQGAAGTVINRDNYPVLEAIQERSVFSIGEEILVNGMKKNLFVSSIEESSVKIKVTGDDIKVGDILLGVDSGNSAEVIAAQYGEGIFNIDFSIKKDIGWQDDIGMLDLDNQVVPDNDYYQNLSYSIKSPLTYKKTTEVIKGTLHTSGMRDFADTGITSTTTAGISDTEDQTSIFKDIITETRVDKIREFDLGRDVDVVDGSISKFVKFANKRLTDFVECVSNRVLSIDDINSQFSNLESEPSTFVNLFKLEGRSYYDNLIRVTNLSGDQVQVSDLVILESNGDYFLFNRGTVVNRGSDLLHNNGELYGEFSIFTDSLNESYFRFTPVNTTDIDYDLKYRTSQFTVSTVGIATQSIGFIDLASSTGITTQTGVTTALYTANTTDLNGLFADLQVINTATDEMNFVSAYMTHNGTDTFISDYYFDSDETTAISLDEIGEFGANITSGIVTFTYTSDTNDDITIRGRVVGFGSTARGSDVYRYKSIGQADGSERTVVYRSDFVDNVSAATTIFTLDGNLFDSCKSYIRVSIGDTSALHQVMMLQDVDDDIYLQQSPFLSVNSTTGLGTFITNMAGSNLDLQFDPDTTDPVSVSVFSECFYTTVDTLNTPEDLTFGNTTEEIKYGAYNAINGERINRTEFELRHNDIPIFAKTFDPSGSKVNLATGVFSIDDHFFSNNEELIYTPEATFVGVGSLPMQYENSTAGVTGPLPSTVFAIVTTDNTFQISTTSAGTAVTFTSVGEGNAHMFEMAKKNSKSLIVVDNIAQYPLTFSPINHALDNNGGSIGAGNTVFALAGISTIKPKDILKVDDEFMSVQNVGFGTTNVGPISNTGSIPLVEVKRGVVGSASTQHQDTTGIATVFKGGYNIVGKNIHFTQAPRGNPQLTISDQNLESPKSDFNGRVFLRQDYSTNQIYDDVSDKFTGISSTFDLTLESAPSVGIGTSGGNGVLFINGIFQTPTTANNPDNNFRIIEDTSAGVSSVRFSGITSTNGNLFTSTADVNIGQLPRGGMIVSLGSTGGLGYAPLDGAIVAPTIGANGSIGSVVVGFGSTSDIKNVTDGYMISTATYNASTGVLEVTTVEPHKFTQNVGEVFMEGLHFECAAQHAGVTTTIFPDGSSPFGQRFPVLGITSATTFTANVGICTIPHNYVGFGSVYSFLSGLSVGSGYREWGGGTVSVAVTDLVYPHRFVSAGVNSITDNIGGTHTATDAEYDSPTGILKLTIPNHGLTDANTIGIATDSLVFTCSRDNYQTNHAYPRAVSLTRKRRGESGGDPAHNVNLGITTFTTNTLSVGVGSGGGAGSGATINHVVGAGGTLGFSVGAAGTEYVNPHIDVSEPAYNNLEVVGVSRIGVGATTDTGIGLLLDIEVGASSTTGIGSTLHQVTGFKIARTGYSFKNGDIFTPVGLVTDRSLVSPMSEFRLEVLDTFTDNFGSWQFGELDYIDSIRNLQDGTRTRFPLFYNNELLSFETATDSSIDLSICLLIMIDGVIQVPGEAYLFEGGTTFAFTAPPLPESKVDIFFYRGTRGQDTVLNTSINQIIERGDDIQLLKNNAIRTTKSQSVRSVFNLTSSDSIETNKYLDEGINETDFKPVDIIKQKVDKVLNGEVVHKTRDSIEGQIYPVGRVIADFSTTDTQIFLDNTDLFDYDNPVSIGFMAVTGIGSTTAVGNVEFVSDATDIDGFSGIITGITTSVGTNGHPLALQFSLVQSSFAGLNAGFPIYISDTRLGDGATSVFDSDAAVVSIGQTFLDNVYNISALHVDGTTGIITCNVTSTSVVSGLTSTGDANNPVGKFSWGRISGFPRGSSPISIGVTGFTVPSTSVGISTFPIVQRREVGLRGNGSLPKQL